MRGFSFRIFTAGTRIRLVNLLIQKSKKYIAPINSQYIAETCQKLYIVTLRSNPIILDETLQAFTQD